MFTEETKKCNWKIPHFLLYEVVYFVSNNFYANYFYAMKNKDIQALVLSKYKKGDSLVKIFDDLNGSVCYGTIQRWCQKIRKTGSIDLHHPSGRKRSARSKNIINKVKSKLKGKKNKSIRILGTELSISHESVRTILKEDLQLYPYKIRIEPRLTDEQQRKRMKFANWIRHKFKKNQTLKILFSDEKIFDMNGMCNAQNDRVWAINRVEANASGGVKQKSKFPQKVMVWLGVCSEGISPMVILDKGTMNHKVYIQKVLPVAKKFGSKVFGNNWVYQQDGASPHTHHLTQQWCKENLPSFIDKEHWPPNSPDLNPLDYFVWDELCIA